MKTSKSVVVFYLEGYRYGMPLDMVERVSPVVEMTPIPDAPDAVMGVINVRGKVMPVINLRSKLKLEIRPIRLSDQLMVCRIGQTSIALIVDSIEGALDYDDDALTNSETDPNSPSVLKTDDGLVYIYNYEHILSSQEQTKLKTALKKVSA